MGLILLSGGHFSVITPTYSYIDQYNQCIIDTYNTLIVSASETTSSHYNLKILRRTNLLKKFCEYFEPEL